MPKPMGRRAALRDSARHAAGLVGLALPMLSGCSMRSWVASPTSAGSAPAYTPVDVGGLWPGLSAPATDAMLRRLHLTHLGNYSFRAAAHGPGDAVLVTQDQYPVMVGAVPGSVGVTLAPLDAPLRLANFNPETLLPGLDSVFVDGKQRFAVPLAWLPYAVFANTTLLQALDLPTPSATPTLGDLLTYCGSVQAALVRTQRYRGDAGMQVLARRDMVAAMPTLLATFIAGFGGDVTAQVSPGEAGGSGVRALSELLVYAGGTDAISWLEGTAVLTIAAGIPTARIPAQVSRFPQLLQPVQPVEVCGLGCSGGFAAHADAVADLATGLLTPNAQRALSAGVGVNPARAALARMDTWVPPGFRPDPLTRIPPGWVAAWDIGVFQGPIWEAALSEVGSALTSEATPRSVAAALRDAIASGVTATRAAIRAEHR